MVKNKRKKGSNFSDKIYEKKSKNVEKKINPFEVQIQKEKFDVLNRRTTHSVGRPLISRSKAIEKRKHTIGQEYQTAVNHKNNFFQDSRKNKNNNNFAGFKPKKESIYNLNDEVELTHKGQRLAELERFDEPVEEDELSDSEARLDDQFTKAAHFGGGNSDEEDESKPRDRKTAIEELIAESKKRKLEKLRENEEMFEKTKQLDDNWKDLLSIVNTMKKSDDDNDKPPQDEYDRLVKEMVFEPRGVVTDKLKTEDEIAREEKDKLQKLENERLARMRGDDPEENKPNHRSADDLDDGYFAIEPVTEEDESNRIIGYEIDTETEKNQEEEGETSGIQEKAEVEEESEEGDSDNEEEAESNEEEESGEEEESEAEDDLEDLKNDSSSEEEELEENLPKDKVLKITETIDMEKPKAPKKQQPESNNLSPGDSETLNKIPFTIEMPRQYEELLDMLTGKSYKLQDIIIERIIKTNHPRLLQENRNKMLVLFAYLLQYINDLFTDIDPENIEVHFKILEQLTPHLYDLLQFNPHDASKCFQDVIKEKQEIYKKKSKIFPKLETIIYFKLVGALYPTSDFRHPIVTPVYVFMNQILTHCRIKNRCDLANGLFLCTLLLDYQELSKRFLPACINFLYNTCYMGIRKSMVDTLKPLPPLKKNPTFDSTLVLKENSEIQSDLKISPKDFVTEEIDEEFKVKSLNLSICLIRDFVELYSDHIGVRYLITPLLKLLVRLQDEDFFPKQVKENLANSVNLLEKYQSEKKFVYLVAEKKKQKMLRLLEPKFETVYSDRRVMYSDVTGKKAEQNKLKHQVKREFKAAKRELRRDNEYLAKVQLKRKIESDRERKDKVKRIFNEASIQQSEYNALQRTKGRKTKF